MDLKSRLAPVAGVFSLALITGYLMQNGLPFVPADTSPQLQMSVRNTSAVAPPQQLPETPIVQVAGATGFALPLDPINSTLQASQTAGSDLSRRLSGLEDTVGTDVPGAQPRVSGFGLPCSFEMTATALPDAMIALDLAAACDPGAVVSLHHAGMRFSGRVDAVGHMKMTVPALAVASEVTARLDDGRSVTAGVTIPDARSVHRVALQWQGRPAMRLHAYERDAAYGAPGHVSHMSAEGVGLGHLMVLDAKGIPGGWSAEVYSLPRAAQNEVAMTIEADVSASTCGREVSAQTLQTGVPDQQVLRLPMPGCDAMGDVLVFDLPPLAEQVASNN